MKDFSFFFVWLPTQGKGTAFEAAGLRIGQTVLQVDGIQTEGDDLWALVEIAFLLLLSEKEKKNKALSDLFHPIFTYS